MTSETLVLGYMNKITKLKDGRYFVGAGTWESCCAVVSWLNEQGDKPYIEKEDDMIGVLIEKGKIPLEITGKLILYPMCIPYASGSGQTIALTAMQCGKTAKEAVQLACKLDIYTGGKIRTIKI